ncbi:hypothetical protein [Ferrimicrobium sp.]|uniref:hypothetical protein n=1 Tax=Ferrimicrobium sp. TaxID=2926050 RepID=UPI0026149215|nr:hypothetical protein [Ferrimicrobium sp.]
MDGEVTIETVLDAFVRDQESRVSARTMRNYIDVITLLRHSLNGYAYQSLDEADTKRFQEALNAGDYEAFCHLFGPEHIPEHFGEFLGYFMVKKVLASQEVLRSAATVTKKLAIWLYEQGYVSEEERDLGLDRAAAARDLPRAERLAELLYRQCGNAPTFNLNDRDSDDLIEDLLTIERVEPGALYFAGGIGPLAVSEQASALAKVGWDVYLTLVRVDGTWWAIEVGNVYAM